MHFPSPAERFLEDFHQRRPGTTSAAFAHLCSEQHESSYAALAATLPDSSASLSAYWTWRAATGICWHCSSNCIRNDCS